MLSSPQAGMPPNEMAEIRSEAVPVIAAYRDSGCEPHALSRELLVEMMTFLSCEPLSDRLAELMLFDMAPEGGDLAAITWGDEFDEAVKADSPVVVIGAGMAGIQAGIRLAQAGLPFTIIEKNAGPGGTWYENRYPGARVDVPSHQYCYSFEPGDHWSEYFCQHPELRNYFTTVLDKYALRPHCRFETEVAGAEWDEERGRWRVRIRPTKSRGGADEPGQGEPNAQEGMTGELRGARDRDSGTEILEARFIISAVGSLNIPKLPEIEGMESFAGPSFHSTRWPEDFDHSGKKFALLGAGASGFQIAPTIADEVESLSIFQRTAQWVMPNEIYHKKVPKGETWAMQHLPFYGRWLRFVMTEPGLVSGVEPFRIDPGYQDPDGTSSVNPINKISREFLMDFMRSHLGDREDLIEKLTPDYPAMGKRVLQDNGSWFQALKKPNVDLVRTGIERIESDGIRTVDGKLHEADVICYATGFEHNQFLGFDLIGRNGVSIHEQWRDEPTAYLGITVPNFPNVFLCYGPGTNLAHSAGLFFHAEYQTMHAMDAIHQVLRREARSIEVKPEVHERYVKELVERISALVWSHPSIQHSHYKNPDGKIYTLSPWPIDEYWEMTREVDPADYRIE